ncbi:MAG: hypothetical protein OXF25_05735 [Cyanobacteria bacterium MAG CAR3_bin_5]|nr:hypothetical protein [Cyanobacteria bacterium MAG CAR4_bin_6]MCY4173554.1 hypothetical protein [Cyanobacteria bacterium MAG CAR3_bin_5]
METGPKDGATGHREGNGRITITDDGAAGVTVQLAAVVIQG